jgi:hypothetical protein
VLTRQSGSLVCGSHVSAVAEKQLLDHDMLEVKRGMRPGTDGKEDWASWASKGVLLVSLIFLPSPLKFLRGGLVKGWPYPLVKVGATGISMGAPPSGRL